MRFRMMVNSSENSGAPPKDMMEAIATPNEQGQKSGKMAASGGLADTLASRRVRVSQGRLSVTDGPFAETREVVGGYAIMEFETKAEAIHSARVYGIDRRYWPGCVGETES